MTTDDVRKMLLAACEEAGSQRAWAHAHDVSPVYVNDVLGGRRSPGPAICSALGVEAIAGETQYRLVQQP
jgi:hypothetical protein